MSAQYAEAQVQAVHDSLEGTIDLSPTDDGWTIIAERFLSSTRGDFTERRREDATVILGSIVEIVFYLGSKNVGTVEARDLRDRLIHAADPNR